MDQCRERKDAVLSFGVLLSRVDIHSSVGCGEGYVTHSWLPSQTVYLSPCSPVYPKAEELCESRGGRPGLPVPNSPYGLCGRKARLNEPRAVQAQGLCENRGGHAGLPIPNNPYGLRGRVEVSSSKRTVNLPSLHVFSACSNSLQPGVTESV